MFKRLLPFLLVFFSWAWVPSFQAHAAASTNPKGSIKVKAGNIRVSSLAWGKSKLACQIKGQRVLKVGLVKPGAISKKKVKFSPVKQILTNLKSAASLSPRARIRHRTLKNLSKQAKAACLEILNPDNVPPPPSSSSSSSQASVSPTPNPDSDHDGLPDAWELRYFGNLLQGPLNDPDQDWRTNMEEFLAGTDPTYPDSGVKNPGFEEGLGSDGRPLYWSKYQSNGGTQELDSANPKRGHYSWKLTRVPNAQGQNGYYAAWSEPIPVSPGKRYILRTFVRTETGAERINLGWEEYSDLEGTQSVYVTYFVAYQLAMPTTWSMLTTVPRTPQASAVSVRIRFLIDSDGFEPRSAWFDDFSLIEIGDAQFPAQGCQNNASARCIDFGAPGEQGQGYNPEAMGEAKQDGDIAYREVLPLRTLKLAFEPFESDGDGFPLSPLLLEIRFKDSIDGTLYAQSSIRTEHRARVFSRLDFRNLDPAYERSSEYPYQIGAIGHDNDQRWKHWQFSFANSSYQLIRAIDGKLQLQIRMPNLGPLDAELHLPIDYISLRRSTPADHVAFTERERLYGGFFEVDLPPDRPNIEPNYENPLLTPFTRDLMRPIFPHTRPAENEVSHEISVKTAAGEITAVALGLYSQQGIADLSIEPAALLKAGGGSIPASKIEVFQVVHKDTRLHIYFDKRFAFAPDHLRPFDTLTLPPQTAAALWIRIQVPPDAAGDYSGALNIHSGGQLIESMNIKLHVVPALLDESPHINPLWVDPWLSTEVPDESLDAVLEIFRQTGFDPFLYSFIYPIKSGGQITGFNTERLERLIDRSLSSNNGYGSRRFVLWISDLPAAIYYAVYGTAFSCSNYNLYDQLSTPEYQNAFRAAIAKYLEVAAQKGISVQFFIHDEPTDRPCYRIAADRLYPLIKQAGGVTTVTYTLSTDQPLSISPEQYSVPGQTLPGMTELIDHKIWNASSSGQGYLNTIGGQGYYPHFGFYTTGPGTLRNPIYNRFMHGIFASRTNATSVHAYAMSSYVADPHNDYDTLPSAIGIWTYPDFLFAYPTWNEGLLPTLGLEGIRLGIQDAKYVATLQRLSAQHPGHPAAAEAQNLLSQTFSRLGTNLYQDYFLASPRYRDGSYQYQLKALSETEDPYDFEAFTALREKVIDLISQLLEAP